VFSKIIFFIILVSVIGAVIYHFFIYYDAESGCFIKIAPSLQPSNWDTKQVLEILKHSAPDKYAYLCQKVSTINKNVGCGGLDGGCFYSNEQNTIYIGNDSDNIALTDSIIVHELCHVKQFETKQPMSEVACYREGSKYIQDNLVK
jgi:hypothetical protein